MKKPVIYCVCGVGLGTSLMAKMSVDKLLKEIELKARVEATDAGSAKGQPADLVITTEGIAKALGTVEQDIVVINNFADKAEFREKVMPKLLILKEGVINNE